MPRSIVWNKDSDTLITSDGLVIVSNASRAEFYANLNEVEAVLLEDLVLELARVQESLAARIHGPASLSVASPSVDEFEDSGPFDTFLLDAQSRIIQELQISAPLISDPGEIEQVLGPLLSAHGISIVSTPVYQKFGGGPQGNSPWVELLMRPVADATVGECIQLSRVIHQVLTRKSLSPTTPFGAYSLVLAGLSSALLGQSESQWLEVKAKGYGLDNDRQKHELACDLTALANTESGGVIIIGLATRKNSFGQDVVYATPGCSPGDINTEQYVEVAKNRIVPPIDGLAIRLCEASGRHYLAMYIPAQPSFSQPFIVKGGIIANGRWTGAAFTINTRVGSDKWAMSAEAVHSLLVAARAALANGSS